MVTGTTHQWTQTSRRHRAAEAQLLGGHLRRVGQTPAPAFARLGLQVQADATIDDLAHQSRLQQVLSLALADCSTELLPSSTVDGWRSRSRCRVPSFHGRDPNPVHAARLPNRSLSSRDLAWSHRCGPETRADAARTAAARWPTPTLGRCCCVILRWQRAHRGAHFSRSATMRASDAHGCTSLETCPSLAPLSIARAFACAFRQMPESRL
jgi:hypothetical protein